MTTSAPTPESGSAAGPTLTFWGAAQTVTGSLHLLEWGGRRILLECGLYQGKREEARHRNGRFPFHPRHLDAVVISHAHVDHCGNLPTLIRQGFDGPIYCTPATRDLLDVVLTDSAKIQEEDAAHLNIQRHYVEPWVQPLYTRHDADRVMHHVKTVPYDEPREIVPGFRLSFSDAGHVLGSAVVHVKIATEAGERRLTFTGDLGRRNTPILNPAAPIPPADLLVCESTYGGRLHEPIERTAEKLWEVVKRTIARGGKVLVPAFSLGRTQLVVHFLHRGIAAGVLPMMPIYVDSPLAADIADVYRQHPECLDEEGRRHTADGPEYLGGGEVKFVRSFEESMQLGTRPGPSVLVAASGMCEAGRILQHLKHNIDDPRCSIVLVSYQAAGTVGRKLLEPKPTVRFLGRDWNKWADVVHLDGFSAHADRADFEAYLAPLAGQVGKVRLVHGEREQSAALAQSLDRLGFTDVSIPEPGESVAV
jgi:metallo-beta-lactamase family protein